MARVCKAGAPIVLIDPNWRRLTIEGDNVDQDKVKAIAKYSGDDRDYGVVNPSVAEVSATFLEKAGATNIVDQVYELQTSLYDRADYAIGISRKLQSLVERGDFGEAAEGKKAAAAFVDNLKHEMAAGRAMMTFQYHVVTGLAPNSP